MRADIRSPIPKNINKVFAGQTITGVRRRAKYLFIDTPVATLISHLGMTGSWRLAKPGEKDPHDHFFIDLADKRALVFRDPRRFGLISYAKAGEEQKHPSIKSLGPEPLDPKHFNAEYLFQISRKRQIAVKTFIMDQKVVVGVGNIYASEVLFQAKVRPLRKAGRLTLDECVRIVDATTQILNAAINAGGSSIRDYRGAGGEEGLFQQVHLVYDREGEECVNCGEIIHAKVIGGRSSFWCSECQR